MLLQTLAVAYIAPVILAVDRGEYLTVTPVMTGTQAAVVVSTGLRVDGEACGQRIAPGEQRDLAAAATETLRYGRHRWRGIAASRDARLVLAPEVTCFADGARGRMHDARRATPGTAFAARRNQGCDGVLPPVCRAGERSAQPSRSRLARA